MIIRDVKLEKDIKIVFVTRGRETSFTFSECRMSCKVWWMQARRREIAAEADRRTEALKDHLTQKVGSSEQKAELIQRQRALEAEEARLRKQADFNSRKQALLRNRCRPSSCHWRLVPAMLVVI